MRTTLGNEWLYNCLEVLLQDDGFNDRFLESLQDQIQKQARLTLLHKKLPIPAFLMNYCEKCGSYISVIATDQGQRCRKCIYVEEQKNMPKKIQGWIVVYKQDGTPIRQLGKVNGVSGPEVAAAYNMIAKRAGYAQFTLDPSDGFIGGYYSNDKFEKVILSLKEVKIEKQNKAVSKVR